MISSRPFFSRLRSTEMRIVLPFIERSLLSSRSYTSMANGINLQTKEIPLPSRLFHCNGRPASSMMSMSTNTENNTDTSSTKEYDGEQIVSPQDIKLAIDATEEATGTGSEETLTNLPGSQSGGKKLAIVFTCNVCNTRSAKQFTEHAYQNGVVLVRCPGCKNLHLIADRLGMFEDMGEDGKGWDIEKAMSQMGQDVVAVTNDNVLEVTMKDVLGDKLGEIIEEKSREYSAENATRGKG